jgi:branched-chain amino acid transport system substrate-binding protein
MGGVYDQWGEEFKKKYNDDFYTGSIYRMLESLSQAMAQTKSTDPVKVAAALEGLKWKSMFGGDVEMRRTDHQLQQPLYITVWRPVGGKFTYSIENTGMTLATVAEYPNYVSSTPTSCQMKRPSSS